MKVLLIAASLLMSCGKTESSTVSWGALSSALRSTTLLDSESVLLCGEYKYRKAALDAYWAWTEPIPHRRAEVWWGDSCVAGYEATIDVGIDYGCSANVVGWHTNAGKYHRIRICSGFEWALKKSMLHEMGHAVVGACDTYRPGVSGIAFHDNCKGPRTRAKWSIMNALSPSSPDSLTQDDIDFVKYLDRNL